MHGHEGRVMCAKFDPFSRRIVTGDELGQVLVWKKVGTTTTGNETTCQEDYELPVNPIDTGNSRIVGILQTAVGIDIAVQKGHLLSLDFLGS